MLTAHQEYTPPELSGGQITEATRKLLSVPFGRRQMERMKTVADIDRHLEKIQKKYKKFGGGIDHTTKDE